MLVLFAALPLMITTLYTCAAQQQRIPLIGLISNSSSVVGNSSSYIATFVPSGGVFVPFMWTQGFAEGPKGYAFGFWAVPSGDFYNESDFYLCTCIGQATKLQNSSGGVEFTDVKGRFDNSGAFVLISSNSFAAPVWNANPERPLAYGNASLKVATDAHNAKVLELRDGNGSLVWSLFMGGDAAFMELQDSGNLVILDSANHTVWQSFQHPTDALVVGQNFSEGMSLTSNDSVFSVTMEPRGLAFYLRGFNNASFWILPSTSASHAYTPHSFVLYRYGFFSNYGVSCAFDEGPNFMDTDLVRLEGDGRLHLYTVTTTSLMELISTLDTHYCYSEEGGQLTSPQSIWGACDTPMQCGPMGLCLPKANPSCVCPAAAGAPTTTPVFQQVDKADVYKGCTLTSNLYTNFCAGSNESSTLWDFLEVIHTATIFQFSNDTLSTYNTPATTVDNCKKTCLIDCSCMGVIFNHNQSLCFPMTDHRLSLLQVAGRTNFSYTAFLKVAPGGRGAHHSNISVVVAATCGIAVLIVALTVYIGCHRGIIKRPRGYTDFGSSENQDLEIALSSLPTKFSFKELHRATKGFSNIIGKGGMGSVYAGALPDGKPIAVKKLDIILDKGGKLSKVFLAEVAAMGKTSHFNILQLVGFCWETDQQMLVYEYMEKGSLDAWIFRPGKDKLLEWATRFKIGLGIAKGLAYLHEDCSQPILHLDIKPQNILLGPDFEPKLADFGLAKLVPRETGSLNVVAQTVAIRGTPGYMAPEMATLAAPLSKKCDIYSLGIVLLEVVGGRRSLELEWLLATLNAAISGKELPVNDREHVITTSTSKAGSFKAAIIEREEEEWHLPSLAAKRCAEGRKMEVVDKQLRGEFCEEEASRMIEVALWCIQDNPSLRPAAETVVQWLEGSSVQPLDNAPLIFSSVAQSQSRLKSNIRQASYISMLADDTRGGKKRDPESKQDNISRNIQSIDSLAEEDKINIGKEKREKSQDFI